MLSIPALLLTAGWLVLVGVILVLFGRTAGGAWSIAGSVARGITEWAGSRLRNAGDAASPAGSTSQSAAETIDLGDRPT